MGKPTKRSLSFTAFAGPRRIATGTLPDVAAAARAEMDTRPDGAVLVFDDETGGSVEVDFRGSADDVRARLTAPAPAEVAEARATGRPKLGVVAREVTLLPRHWEWLATQRGGASAALRRIVDQARRHTAERDIISNSRAAAYRFLTVIAGDFPGYEEAIRALYGGNEDRFRDITAAWPADVRDYARNLARDAFWEEMAL